jgi:hypothetical protein
MAAKPAVLFEPNFIIYGLEGLATIFLIDVYERLIHAAT